MSERVTMPALGESVTEGTVTRWLKSVGDSVEVDEPLRTALRPDLRPDPTPGNPARRTETPMDPSAGGSALRPRDIQARIRAGATPEDVAAAAGTPLEKVMPFANPVLAERAHVAERAQRSSVRRRTGEPGGQTSGARTLGDAAAVRLREHGGQGFAEAAGAASGFGAAMGGAAVQEKTLRCPDCGAMNYPTEWYCEKCGGELAAL